MGWKLKLLKKTPNKSLKYGRAYARPLAQRYVN